MCSRIHRFEESDKGHKFSCCGPHYRNEMSLVRKQSVQAYDTCPLLPRLASHRIKNQVKGLGPYLPCVEMDLGVALLHPPLIPGPPKV